MAIGQKLEEARNRKGISLREASESTKIRGDYLSSFEAGNFDINLPEVYLRGFIRLYARYLDLDQDAVVADLEIELGNSSSRNSKKSLGSIASPEINEINEPSSSSPSSKRISTSNGIGTSFKKPIILVGVAIVLIFSTITWLLLSNSKEETEEENLVGNTASVEESNDEELSQNDSSTIQLKGQRKLTISVVGSIERLIISDEGKEPKEFHEFKNLTAGWSTEINFTESFRCYSSALENVRFAVDDGQEKQVEGQGSGNFAWTP